MKTIMISCKAWDACWRIFHSNPNLTATSRSLLDATAEIATLNSAQKCICALRDTGLINPGNSKLSPLGRKWATVDHYADACRQIADRFFPARLITEAFEEGLPRQEIAQWLMKHEGMQEAGAGKNATFLLMLKTATSLGVPPLQAESNLPEVTPPQPSESQKPPAKCSEGALSIKIDASLSPSQIANVLSAISSSLSAKELEIVFSTN